MAGKKRVKRRSRELVLGYLEKASSQVFRDYSKELTELAGKRHGVYALYKGSRLYYVGLATNLRNRIQHHLQDRHSGKWDKFSLYLVRKADHIKELEALILRISDPAGNSMKGRLRHAENMKQGLQNRIKDSQAATLSKLLNSSPRKTRKVVTGGSKKRPSDVNHKATLAPYVSTRFPIRATYKGKVYKARLRSDGMINYNGKLYSSPSAAATAVIDRGAQNGWLFWLYRNEKGEWKQLKYLKR